MNVLRLALLAAIPLFALFCGEAVAGVFNDFGPQSPMGVVAGAPSPANEMLRCPLSVPCRAGEPSQPATPVVHGSPQLAMVLLPCPKSVPCIATNPAMSSFRRPLSPKPQWRHRLRRSVRVRSVRAKHGQLKLKVVPAPLEAANPARLAASAKPQLEISLTPTDAACRLAERSLAEADRRLALLEHARLGSRDAQSYAEAMRMRRSARAAMRERDYAMARALSEKAAQLAPSLRPEQIPAD